MGKRVLKSSLIEEDNIVAFFTTRDLPLKCGEREDLLEEVEQNKKLVCQGCNISLENLFIPTQTHSDNVGVIREQKTVNGKQSCGKQKTVHPFTYSPYNFENTDSLVTDQKNMALALNFADCVPIILYDPIKKVIAGVHAGWKGTASKIATKTVQKMVEEFHCKPEDIIALIGPCIGQCCFEVKEDVKEKILRTVGESKQKLVCDNMCVDLKLVNKIQLLDSGVVKIDVSEYCTSCQSELFFSYRKENGNTARHSAVVMLK